MEPPPAPQPTRTEALSSKAFLTEAYDVQARDLWPGHGKHILAQFDEDSLVVYQAYKREIAEYAAANGKFEGAPGFNMTRMTWIKPNFLWMMYRSQWASRPNQDHVLAIWLRQSAFESYLANARKKGSVRGFTGSVRLQWDPDHFPNGKPHPYRRALQLGLRGVTSYLDGSDILRIEDISPFVHAQGRKAAQVGTKKLAAPQSPDDALIVARERIYTPASKLARQSVELAPSGNGDEN